MLYLNLYNSIKLVLHKNVVIFPSLPIMLDRDPNKANVGGDHCWLTTFMLHLDLQLAKW